MTRLTERKFGLTFAAVFSFIALGWWLRFGTVLSTLIVVAVLLLLVAWFLPAVLLPFNRIWGAVARRLAVANTYFILGIMFIFIFVPVRLVMKLVGHDPMQRCWDSTAASYFVPTAQQATAESYRDQF
jgi:Saxitoxin biosynthesis operon protein SxtJ